jgi:hypothetical protein
MAMRHPLLLAVALGLFAGPPAAGEGSPQPEALPSALAEVGAEKAEALRQQSMDVTIRLGDGSDREGRLQDYKADTGVLVVQEKGKALPTQLKDSGIATIEFRQPSAMERPTMDLLREVLRERNEAIQEEVRKAKADGKLDDYMKEQTAKLKTAPDQAAGLAALGRLVAAGFHNNMKRDAIATLLEGILPSVQTDAVRREIRWMIARLNGRRLERPGPPGIGPGTGPGHRRGPGEGGTKGPEPEKPQ